LTEALAHRAALAIGKARLYRVAQRALQARDEVIGIVAHDLRNPLHVIILEASLLKCLLEEQAPRFRNAVLSIDRSAVRMNRMIQDLLDIARVEAGGLVVERTRVPVGQLICDAVDAQKPIAAAASLDLRLEVARDVPDVWADRETGRTGGLIAGVCSRSLITSSATQLNSPRPADASESALL